MSGIKGAHHRGTYHVRSRALVAAAYANPSTTCWRCGLTLLQAQVRYPDRRVRWTAGHLHDGQINGPLAPECSPCNYGQGARRGNAMRGLKTNRNPMNTSRRW